MNLMFPSGTTKDTGRACGSWLESTIVNLWVVFKIFFKMWQIDNIAEEFIIESFHLNILLI